MPGTSFRGTVVPFTTEEKALRAELIAHVQKLGGEIGERNLAHYPKLLEAAHYIEDALFAAGWKVERDTYEVQGKPCHNLAAKLDGSSPDIVLIGAHYDSVFGSPGANDNGSGVAALLALARRFAGTQNGRTLRFVAFVNEEPHYFQTSQMGSYVYAARCRARRDPIVAMISLETIGYYSREPGSQNYPAPGLGFLYPRTGNFIGFVGNVGSASLLRDAIGEFRQHAQIPSEGAALPAMIPGVGWSDQWSFWQHDYPGIMVTDTAPFRYPQYHAASDTPDKLDYDSMTRVVSGMEKLIQHLANPRR
ncbi:MAG TPA: M28 family peptidase [Chthoniobacterales bacterium]|nr:M28 family peptidase [Chthoniobacterales bacterium]